jgi:hypothetical protein
MLIDLFKRVPEVQGGGELAQPRDRRQKHLLKRAR